MKVQQVEVHDVDNFYYKKTVVLSKNNTLSVQLSTSSLLLPMVTQCIKVNCSVV